MNRLVLIGLLLACVGSVEGARYGAKRYLHKESPANMSAAKSIFIGWLDMVPDNWRIHDYGDKESWQDAINKLNESFQRLSSDIEWGSSWASRSERKQVRALQTEWLSGRTITGSKNKEHECTADNDLYISFSDVKIDYENYLLYLAIHFINPKTKAEIASIPARPYFGNGWGFERFLTAALQEVNLKIQTEVTGTALKK